MKTREFKKSAAGLPLPTAHPSAGELAKASPAELAGAEPAGLAAAESEESAEVSKNKAKLRWYAGLFAALAAFFLLLGEEWYAMFLAALALGNALDGETRWRVPKLVMYCVFVLVVVLSIIMFVLLTMKVGGR
jgi:hypothetical protein